MHISLHVRWFDILLNTRYFGISRAIIFNRHVTNRLRKKRNCNNFSNLKIFKSLKNSKIQVHTICILMTLIHAVNTRIVAKTI